ncbi:MAG: hypothetical protein KC445_20580, partial [Anaerolineales bacterium]|nr:hypothetical protein [Anaerolineales bacterium]
NDLAGVFRQNPYPEKERSQYKQILRCLPRRIQVNYSTKRPFIKAFAGEPKGIWMPTGSTDFPINSRFLALPASCFIKTEKPTWGLIKFRAKVPPHLCAI